ncbi:hypothetical protein MRB53_039808 [Persea americana]|nr:hypothetical protein MRB53_039808 [Persea americana]
MDCRASSFKLHLISLHEPTSSVQIEPTVSAMQKLRRRQCDHVLSRTFYSCQHCPPLSHASTLGSAPIILSIMPIVKACSSQHKPRCSSARTHIVVGSTAFEGRHPGNARLLLRSLASFSYSYSSSAHSSLRCNSPSISPCLSFLLSLLRSHVLIVLVDLQILQRFPLLLFFSLPIQYLILAIALEHPLDFGTLLASSSSSLRDSSRVFAVLSVSISSRRVLTQLSSVMFDDCSKTALCITVSHMVAHPKSPCCIPIAGLSLEAPPDVGCYSDALQIRLRPLQSVCVARAEPVAEATLSGEVKGFSACCVLTARRRLRGGDCSMPVAGFLNGGNFAVIGLERLFSSMSSPGSGRILNGIAVKLKSGQIQRSCKKL